MQVSSQNHRDWRGRRLTALPSPMSAVWVGPVLALVLSACGGVGTPEIDPGTDPEGVAFAPECHEVDELVAVVPEDQEPTGTTPEPVEDGPAPDSQTRGDAELESPTPDSSPLDRDAEGPAPERDGGTATAGQEPADMGQQLQLWGEQDAAESFAGLWVDQELGGFAVAFTTDVDRYAEEVRERFDPGIAVAEADNTYAELRETQERISQEEAGVEQPASGAVRSIGAQVMINRTTVGIFDPDEQRLADLSETYGASTICFEIEQPPGPIAEGVTPLVKASGWRDDFPPEAGGFAVIEIAYDREAAERAWQDNVPDGLEPRDDELPAEPGLYGDLGDVDFDRQALVVWSTGESGSCPGWLGDIDTRDGTVVVERGATEQMCTDDYNPYRMVLAVDLDRLPQEGDLPHARVEGVPDGEVRSYPDGD